MQFFLLKLAWRNLWRNKRRTAITIFALTIAVILMILFAGIARGMWQHMEYSITRILVSDYQVHERTYLEEQGFFETIEDYQTVQKNLQALGVMVAPRWYGYGLISNDFRGKSVGVQVSGVVPDREKQVVDLHQPRYFREGHYLRDLQTRFYAQIDPSEKDNIEASEGDSFVDPFPDSNYMDEGQAVKPQPALVVEEILLGGRVAETLEAKLGDTVVLITSGSDGSIGNELFRVVGILKNIGETVDRTRVFVVERAFRRVFSFDQDATHELAIRVPKEVEFSKAAGTSRIARSDLVVRSWRKIMPTVADLIEISRVTTRILALIIYMAAALVVLNSLLMMVFERVREMGIMQALGFSRWRIFSLVMMESTLMSLIALAIGGTLSIGFNHYLVLHGIDLSNFVPNGFDFSGTTIEPVLRSVWHVMVFLEPMILLLIVSLASAIYPALKVSRMTPVKAIYSR